MNYAAIFPWQRQLSPLSSYTTQSSGRLDWYDIVFGSKIFLKHKKQWSEIIQLIKEKEDVAADVVITGIVGFQNKNTNVNKMATFWRLLKFHLMTFGSSFMENGKNKSYSA